MDVWTSVEAGAQPILDMVVTDSKLDDALRPTFLRFDGEIEPGEPFAHMIENPPLIAALTDRAKELGVALLPFAVARFENSAGGIAVTLSNGETIAAKLLVAADGARSAIREQAGIKSFGWQYGQSGIVTTIAHEREHNGRAEEHFLPAGPFAILPLKGKRSSIVWTEEEKEAERIVALPDTDFHAETEKRFGLHLGDISRSPVRAAPIRSGFRSRAPSSPSASRLSATPRMSFTRSRGRD